MPDPIMDLIEAHARRRPLKMIVHWRVAEILIARGVDPDSFEVYDVEDEDA